MNVVRYIYQNPLRANICKKCQDYPFSDLRIQPEHLHKINWLNLVLGNEEVARTKNKLRQFVLDVSPYFFRSAQEKYHVLSTPRTKNKLRQFVLDVSP